MEIYLVGGAIRDELLGLSVKERDWVVVGSTPEEMLHLGYIPVGKDFPVFLHPTTHEEYALARTERKIGRGYKGFKFYTDPNVTLEEDLKRRDLTINAIAKNQNGSLIDPYNGQADLQNKTLRHVSEAFVEDPVRILRVARFAARFTDFSIHSSTLELMQKMVANGEINFLVAERVWQELERALASTKPSRFFFVLKECHALKTLFPEFADDKLFEVAINSLDRATMISNVSEIRFAVFLGVLPIEKIKNICQRLKIPTAYQDLALLVAKNKDALGKIDTLSTDEIVTLLENLDAFRRPQRAQEFAEACKAFLSEAEFAKIIKLQQAYAITNKISAKDLVGKSGQEIKQELHKRRAHSLQGIDK
jgi:tRNA nucleotidyltransferase (CCA-adding enzyme)